MENQFDAGHLYKKQNISFASMSIEAFFSSDKFQLKSKIDRKYTWSVEQASCFIETILLNFPIPSITIYYDLNKSKNFVIDGFQRLYSLYQFLNDQFELTNIKDFPHLNSLKYSELTPEMQFRINSYDLSIIMLKEFDESNLNAIYKRLNAISKPECKVDFMSNKRLKVLIQQMNSYKGFETLFTSLNITEEDRFDYLIRFLALYENLNNYNGNMTKFINSYIANSELNLTPERELKLINMFKNTIDACKVIFGDDAFKNCINYQTPRGVRNIMYKTISKPVFELQMLGVADIDFAQIYRHADIIKQVYETMLIADEKFRPHYKKMSRRAVEYRINAWKKIIREITQT